MRNAKHLTYISSSFGSYLAGTDRKTTETTYDYGFNGKRKDDEMHSVSGSSYDFDARLYNSRLGRFLSIDPLSNKYPLFTPYQYASNSPIQAIDLDGMEGIRVVNHITHTTTILLNIVYVPKPLTNPTDPKVKHSNFTVEEAAALEQQLYYETGKECFEDCQNEDPTNGNGYPVIFQFNFIKKDSYEEAQAAVRAERSSTTYLKIFTPYIEEDGSIIAGGTVRGRTQISSKRDSHTLTHEIFHNLVHRSDNVPEDCYGDEYDPNNQKSWHNNGKYGGGIFYYGVNSKDVNQKNVTDALNHLLLKIIMPEAPAKIPKTNMGPPTETEMNESLQIK